MKKKRQKAPGKAFRKAISYQKLFKMFPDDKTSEEWFAVQRWGDKPACPHCGSVNVQSGARHKSMPYRCREKGCAKRFSVRTGSVMQSSNLGYQTWAVAIYLVTTNLKGVSSMKLHRDLGITQKSAWHLAHRIRETWKKGEDWMFPGPVEVDETFMGGRERNKHEHKRSHVQGPVGKTVVVGMKDRRTNKIAAKPVSERTKEELHGFIGSRVSPGAKVYTDDHRSYIGLPNHETVNHSVGEYVRDMAHTNGVESFWAAMKRGYYGTYHKISEKHLERYVNEFSGRHNVREFDTIDQMALLARGMVGKRLTYKELVN